MAALRGDISFRYLKQFFLVVVYIPYQWSGNFCLNFRQTGAYAQILWRILAHDFLQFIVVFLVILLAFSGSFILSLKGEHSICIHNETR
jgi:hypothetical protein